MVRTFKYLVRFELDLEDHEKPIEGCEMGVAVQHCLQDDKQDSKSVVFKYVLSTASASTENS